MKYKIIGYLLFFVACLVFLLYRQFPGQRIADDVHKYVSNVHPAMSVQLHELSPSLPLGMKTDSVRISWLDHPVVELHNTRCRIELRTLFSQNKQLNYQADVLNGRISGTVVSEKNRRGTFQMASQLESLVLEEMDLGKNLSNARLSGLLNGHVDAILDNNRVKEKKGEITIQNGQIAFKSPVFAIEAVTFSAMQLQFNLIDHQRLQIAEFQMTGRQLDITASGEIQLDRNFDQSQLNLRLRMVLHPLFFMDAGELSPVEMARDESDNAILDLAITGTLQNPIISVGRDVK